MREMVKIWPVEGKNLYKGNNSICMQWLSAGTFGTAVSDIRYFNWELNNGMFPMPLVQAGYKLRSKYIFISFAILRK